MMFHAAQLSQPSEFFFILHPSPFTLHTCGVKRERTEAIVLQTFQARERDKLVVFITPDHGKRKGWVYGVRSNRVRFGASLELLAKISIGYLEKESEEIVRIESVDLIRSLFDVHQELRTSLAATYIAETIDTFSQSDDPSELTYRLLDRSSEALLETRNAVAVVAYVEIWILKLAGIFPSMRDCARCHGPLTRPLRHDEAQNGFVCPDCATRSAVLPNAIVDVLERILRVPVSEFAAQTHSVEAMFEIRSIARAARRNFLGHELKSHDLLESVLARA